jgi:hypothetical protein
LGAKIHVEAPNHTEPMGSVSDWRVRDKDYKTGIQQQIYIMDHR